MECMAFQFMAFHIIVIAERRWLKCFRFAESTMTQSQTDSNKVLSSIEKAKGTGYRGSTGTKKASGRTINSREGGYAGGQHKSKIIKQVLESKGRGYYTEDNVVGHILDTEHTEVYEKYYSKLIPITTWGIIVELLTSGEYPKHSGCLTDTGVSACDKPGFNECILPKQDNDIHYGHAEVWIKYFVNSLEKPIESIENYYALTGRSIMDEEAVNNTTVVQQITQSSPQIQSVVSPSELSILEPKTKKEIEERYLPSGKSLSSFVLDKQNLKSNYRTLKVCWESPQPLNILIDGHKGTGKTLLVRKFASDNKIPLYSLDCSNETTEEHLVGSMVNMGTYQLGAIPTAFQIANKYGKCILHLDEMSCLLKTQQKLLNSLLDDRQSIHIPSIDKEYKLQPHAKLMIIGTMNPVTSRNEYEVEELNPDLKSRFFQCHMGYPDESMMIKIIKAQFPKEHVKILNTSFDMQLDEDDDSTSNTISELLLKTSTETQQQEIGYTISPRDIVSALRFFFTVFDYNANTDDGSQIDDEDENIIHSLRMTLEQLIRKADAGDGQKAMADLLERNFKHIVGPLHALEERE